MSAATPPTANPASAQNVVVSLEDVSVEYRSGRSLFKRQPDAITAVEGVSLAVRRGASLGIVGATGSGKSTLAQVVMGMIRPSSGSVLVDGLPPHAVRGRVQMVMQDPYSSLDGRMKVGDIIAEPLTLGRRLHGAERGHVEERVRELLARVGLPSNRAERYPHQFSGGQRQRVAIARALAPDPSIIVLDEPTSALDVSVKAQILKLLRSLQESYGVTYLVISHDLVTVAYLATEMVVMHRGQIVESSPTDALFTAPRHPYTLELLASSPGASSEFLNRARPVDVAPESLPENACRYAYRCSLRASLGHPARCLAEPPSLRPENSEHPARCHYSEDVTRLALAADDQPTAGSSSST